MKDDDNTPATKKDVKEATYTIVATIILAYVFTIITVSTSQNRASDIPQKNQSQQVNNHAKPD